MSKISFTRCLFITGFALFAALPQAWSQAWPAKQISVTVGLQAGAGSYVAVRDIAEKLGTALGQNVVVTSVPGAAGLLAAQQVAKVAFDGYNLVALSGATVTTLPLMLKNFTPMRDLIPVAMIVSFPSVLSVNSKVPAANIREFLELTRKNPGKYTYASGGNGSVQHTAMESLKHMAKIDLLHVPYKGMAQATTDLVGGQVDAAIQGVVAVIPFAKTGQVRVLAWTGTQRNPLYPDLPTLAEAGITGYQFQSWTALFAPAGTPRDVVARLNAEIRKIATSAELRDRWIPQAMESMDLIPAQIDKLIRDDSQQMERMIKETGLKLE
jgi:tripartite-type tricarboxylate transporter receptor subunit TctC